MPRRTMLALFAVIWLLGCDEQPENRAPPVTQEEQDPQQNLERQLSNATAGAVIEVPAGRYDLTAGLSLAVDGVTLRGASGSKTIFNFAKQKQAGAALLVKASDVTIEDIAIENSKGDAIKIAAGKNLVVRRVRIGRTGSHETIKPGYGIHAVHVENLLVEDTLLVGASTAGIYISQSKNIILRRNRAEFNVAAIQLENCSAVEINRNTTIKNSIGILLINLPGLSPSSSNIRIYDNKVYGNNKDNPGAPGTAVSALPAGLGIMINASDNVEIVGNYIADNKTANVFVGSYFSAAYYQGESVDATNFDAYPEKIFIRSNKFSGGGEAPDKLEWETLREQKFGTNGSLSDIVWDGYTNPDKTAAATICVDNAQASFVNIDAANGYRNVDKNLRPYQCLLPKLPAVQLPGME